MVFCVVKPSFRDASCCRLDVVNGAAGNLRRSERLMACTEKRAPSQLASTFSASSRLFSSAFSPPKPVKRAEIAPAPIWNFASIDQYSSGRKISISFSRSQIIFAATDCTRPALKPFLTFCQSSGLIL